MVTRARTSLHAPPTSPSLSQVLAAAPHALSSLHNIDFATLESRNTAKVSLELRVAPFDRFNNTLPTASGYAVSINDELPSPIPPPSFSHPYSVPAGYSGSLRLSFTLNGTHIANSPVTVVVSPDWTLVYVGTAMGVLLLFSLVAFVCYRRISKVKLGRMQSDLLGVERNQSIMKARLEAEKEELEEEVRLKKHSEEELKVMVGALEAVSKERQDELKEVMMESKELKIDRLLGKGGFGVVNLATYRGTKVAMKQVSAPYPSPPSPSSLTPPPPLSLGAAAHGERGERAPLPPRVLPDEDLVPPHRRPTRRRVLVGGALRVLSGVRGERIARVLASAHRRRRGVQGGQGQGTGAG
jgi:hypothetical protein